MPRKTFETLSFDPAAFTAVGRLRPQHARERSLRLESSVHRFAHGRRHYSHGELNSTDIPESPNAGGIQGEIGLVKLRTIFRKYDVFTSTIVEAIALAAAQTTPNKRPAGVSPFANPEDVIDRSRQSAAGKGGERALGEAAGSQGGSRPAAVRRGSETG